MATDTAATASQTLAERGGELRSQVERLDEEVRGFVKERPIMALLSAVAAGYVAGRILRRVF